MLATVELLLLEWGRVRPEVGRRLMTIVTSSIHARIADELGVRYWQVKSAVDLLDGGATVPFISRYRKEATGALDDAQLRLLEERVRIPS